MGRWRLRGETSRWSRFSLLLARHRDGVNNCKKSRAAERGDSLAQNCPSTCASWIAASKIGGCLDFPRPSLVLAPGCSHWSGIAQGDSPAVTLRLNSVGRTQTPACLWSCVNLLRDAPSNIDTILLLKTNPEMALLSLAGKTAVVTGATGAIGLAIASRFVREGARVVLAGRDQAKLNHCLQHQMPEVSNSQQTTAKPYESHCFNVGEIQGWNSLVQAHVSLSMFNIFLFTLISTQQLTSLSYIRLTPLPKSVPDRHPSQLRRRSPAVPPLPHQRGHHGRPAGRQPAQRHARLPGRRQGDGAPPRRRLHHQRVQPAGAPPGGRDGRVCGG